MKKLFISVLCISGCGAVGPTEIPLPTIRQSNVAPTPLGESAPKSEQAPQSYTDNLTQQARTPSPISQTVIVVLPQNGMPVTPQYPPIQDLQPMPQSVPQSYSAPQQQQILYPQTVPQYIPVPQQIPQFMPVSQPIPYTVPLPVPYAIPRPLLIPQTVTVVRRIPIQNIPLPPRCQFC